MKMKQSEKLTDAISASEPIDVGDLYNKKELKGKGGKVLEERRKELEKELEEEKRRKQKEEKNWKKKEEKNWKRSWKK